MKCSILFSGKNKNNITNLPSAELAKCDNGLSVNKSNPFVMDEINKDLYHICG